MSDSPIEVDVIRITRGDQGTFGVLLLQGEAFCVTLEPDWKGNKRNISCIPTGSYLCQRTQSWRFGKAFLVREVPGRSNILLHKGNWIRNTRGCILLGRHFGKHRIAKSRKAYNAFMKELKGKQSFKLNIREVLDED